MKLFQFVIATADVKLWKRWRTCSSALQAGFGFSSFLENGTFNSSSEAEKKAQFYYLSCLNTQKIEELGAQPLTELIAKVTWK